MAMGVVEVIYKFKYFIFCQQKNTGKMARAQGKHRELGINWSVATLYKIWIAIFISFIDLYMCSAWEERTQFCIFALHVNFTI